MLVCCECTCVCGGESVCNLPICHEQTTPFLKCCHIPNSRHNTDHVAEGPNTKKLKHVSCVMGESQEAHLTARLKKHTLF